jgi:hypothetical protein
MIEVEMFFRDSITTGVAMVTLIVPDTTAGAATQSDFSCERKVVANRSEDCLSMKDVEQQVRKDRFVRDQIAVYSAAFWGMCHR